jgi:predicted DNA-binding ribbon-helix-helix protein
MLERRTSLMAEIRLDDHAKKSVRTTVSLPAADYEQLEHLARQKKVSVAWIVREAVDRLLASEAPLFRQKR